jgi:hypothetical protein
MQLSRGLAGSTPLDRVAQTGKLEYTLDNSPANSGGKLGYYSPDNANLRSGWAAGIGVRLKLTYGGNTYTKFLGKIASILPTPGVWLDPTAAVTAVDSLDELATRQTNLIPVQANQRGDELLATLLANLGISPVTDFSVGDDVYELAFHSEHDEISSGLNVCQKIAQSGYDDIYVLGDGTLVYRSRHDRLRATDLAASFSDTMTGLTVMHSADRIYNDVKTSTPKYAVDALPVILYSLPGELRLAPNQVYEFTVRYTDPLSNGGRVSALDLVTPAAETDYCMSGVSGSGGSEQNGNLEVSVVFGANSAQVTLTNHYGGFGFVNRFNLRGRGLYEYDTTVLEQVDTTSRDQYGRLPLTYDMPYQNSANVGMDFNNHLLKIGKDPHTDIDGLEFVANASAALMAAMIACDVGSRIAVAETVTGISREFYVGGYHLAIGPGGLITCQLAPLAPVDTTQYWRMGVPGSSEMGTTTRWAY